MTNPADSPSLCVTRLIPNDAVYVVDTRKDPGFFAPVHTVFAHPDIVTRVRSVYPELSDLELAVFLKWFILRKGAP